MSVSRNEIKTATRNAGDWMDDRVWWCDLVENSRDRRTWVRMIIAEAVAGRHWDWNK